LQLEDKRATEHLIKIGEAGTGKRPSKRPDLKAISKVMLHGIHVQEYDLGDGEASCFEFSATISVIS